MTVYEYHRKQGFKEIMNFMWAEGEEESEENIFLRLGYKYNSYIFSEKDLYWMKIYRDCGNNEYEYLIAVHNKYCTHYVACRTFVDHLEFMGHHLPAIERLNETGSCAC